MKKIMAVVFMFVAIVSIMNYGNGKAFSFKETIEHVSTLAEPPSQPNKTDFDLDFKEYNDYVDEDENVFKKIGGFFTWMGGIFATLFEYIKFLTTWLVYVIKYIVYIGQLITYFLGDVLCGF